MNNCSFIGRLTKDPEVRSTQSNVSVAGFTLAIDRPFKNANGEREADFISFVAWRSTAEFVGKYLKKGQKVGVTGSMQTRSYENKQGNRVYITECVADQIYFAESAGGESGGKPGNGATQKPKADKKPEPAEDKEAAADDGASVTDNEEEVLDELDELFGGFED